MCLLGWCLLESLHFDTQARLTELLISHFFSRLYGFLRVQDPVGDPSLPDLTHKSLLLKVGTKVWELQLVVFLRKVRELCGLVCLADTLALLEAYCLLTE